MNLLQHYFLENLRKNSNMGGGGGVMKLGHPQSVSGRGGPSNWTVVDRGGGGKKFALFCGHHRWMTTLYLSSNFTTTRWFQLQK